MKTIALVLIFYLLTACNNVKPYDHNTIIGKYATINHKRTIVDYFKSRSYVLNDRLNLKKNNSFEMETCSYKATGKWYLKKDTLSLKFDTLVWWIDSLNYVTRFIERKKRIIKNGNHLLVRKNYLYSETKYKEKTIVLKLVRK